MPYAKSMTAFVFAGAVMVFASSAAIADDDYNDWWLCANQCGEEDADCVDACTDDFNETHSTAYPVGLCLNVLTETGVLRSWSKGKTPSAPLGLKMVRGASVRKSCVEKPNKLKAKCPKGTVSIVHEMPVYDEDGLFVVCYKKVPFCVPEDLEPAG
jgi:hypothetical protein